MTSPVVDYEPAPVGSAGDACSAPSAAALRRHSPRPLRPRRSGSLEPSEAAPPRAAAVFADMALRRVLEVLDHRRPVSHLKAVLAPPQLDTIAALSRLHHGGPHHTCAALRRMRLHPKGADAAEVSATYTRGDRVRAIAARIELLGDGRWRVVALQIG
ncbi:Rv3235 family protein [Mycobacterium sp. WMMD1722]|uniref:Rv3235 family protein n=1 Tax=Mycobacterium sp. WMMD1722 TaxID=3404117 RepID=UPI003BF587AF